MSRIPFLPILSPLVTASEALDKSDTELITIADTELQGSLGHRTARIKPTSVAPAAVNPTLAAKFEKSILVLVMHPFPGKKVGDATPSSPPHYTSGHYSVNGLLRYREI